MNFFLKFKMTALKFLERPEKIGQDLMVKKNKTCLKYFKLSRAQIFFSFLISGAKTVVFIQN